MEKQEITEMYKTQLATFLADERTEREILMEDLIINKKGFYKEAAKIGWDIEIHNFIKFKMIEIPIEDATEEELSFLYREHIKDNQENENFGYLQMMVQAAKSKADGLNIKGSDTIHYSECFKRLELIDYLRSAKIFTLPISNFEYRGHI